MNQNTSITQTTAECESYGISINLFDSPRLSDNYIQGVKYSTKNENWTMFLLEFGTHLVADAVLGGRATQ